MTRSYALLWQLAKVVLQDKTFSIYMDLVKSENLERKCLCLHLHKSAINILQDKTGCCLCFLQGAAGWSDSAGRWLHHPPLGGAGSCSAPAGAPEERPVLPGPAWSRYVMMTSSRCLCIFSKMLNVEPWVNLCLWDKQKSFCFSGTNCFP